jgi:hypothetical protein
MLPYPSAPRHVHVHNNCRRSVYLLLRGQLMAEDQLVHRNTVQSTNIYASTSTKFTELDVS